MFDEIFKIKDIFGIKDKNTQQMSNKITQMSSEKKQEMAESLGTAEYEIPPAPDENLGIGNLIRIMLVDAPTEMKRIENEIQKYQTKISNLMQQKHILKSGYDAMMLADKERNNDIKSS